MNRLLSISCWIIGFVLFPVHLLKVMSAGHRANRKGMDLNTVQKVLNDSLRAEVALYVLRFYRRWIEKDDYEEARNQWTDTLERANRQLKRI